MFREILEKCINETKEATFKDVMKFLYPDAKLEDEDDRIYYYYLPRDMRWSKKVKKELEKIINKNFIPSPEETKNNIYLKSDNGWSLVIKVVDNKFVLS